MVTIGDGAGCPCGGGLFGACCGPVLAGARRAATAEGLMRSRYTAFAVGDTAHLLRTWHPRTRPRRLELDPAQRWTGLEVLSVARGGPLDSRGTVSFAARWDHPLGGGVLREVSRFERGRGGWLYVDGDAR